MRTSDASHDPDSPAWACLLAVFTAISLSALGIALVNLSNVHLRRALLDRGIETQGIVTAVESSPGSGSVRFQEYYITVRYEARDGRWFEKTHRVDYEKVYKRYETTPSYFWKALPIIYLPEDPDQSWPVEDTDYSYTGYILGWLFVAGGCYYICSCSWFGTSFISAGEWPND